MNNIVLNLKGIPINFKKKNHCVFVVLFLVDISTFSKPEDINSTSFMINDVYCNTVLFQDFFCSIFAVFYVSHLRNCAMY